VDAGRGAPHLPGRRPFTRTCGPPLRVAADVARQMDRLTRPHSCATRTTLVRPIGRAERTARRRAFANDESRSRRHSPQEAEAIRSARSGVRRSIVSSSTNSGTTRSGRLVARAPRAPGCPRTRRSRVSQSDRGGTTPLNVAERSELPNGAGAGTEAAYADRDGANADDSPPSSARMGRRMVKPFRRRDRASTRRRLAFVRVDFSRGHRADRGGPIVSRRRATEPVATGRLGLLIDNGAGRGDPAPAQCIRARRPRWRARRSTPNFLRPTSNVVFIVQFAHERPETFGRPLARASCSHSRAVRRRVVLLTKSDLVGEVEGRRRDRRGARGGTRRPRVFATSTVSGFGRRGAARVHRRQTARSRSSARRASGKSTTRQRVGRQRRAKRRARWRETDQRGRHTTTATAKLILIPGGGRADRYSPDCEQCRFWDADEGLSRAFPRHRGRFALTCKFNDCSHTVEPGCAIRAANRTPASSMAGALRALTNGSNAEIDEAELRRQGRIVSKMQAPALQEEPDDASPAPLPAARGLRREVCGPASPPYSPIRPAWMRSAMAAKREQLPAVRAPPEGVTVAPGEQTPHPGQTSGATARSSGPASPRRGRAGDAAVPARERFEDRRPDGAPWPRRSRAGSHPCKTVAQVGRGIHCERFSVNSSASSLMSAASHNVLADSSGVRCADRGNVSTACHSSTERTVDFFDLAYEQTS